MFIVLQQDMWELIPQSYHERHFGVVAVQNMAVKALQLARKANRKNFKFSDIEQVVRSDRRCVDMCLKEVLCTESTFAQVRAVGSQYIVVVGTDVVVATPDFMVYRHSRWRCH